jgi:hypothetical protein
MEPIQSNVYSAHPVNMQAGLRTDMQAQDRGPDSLPPAKESQDSAGSGAEYDNSKPSGRYLDTTA